MVFSYSFSGVTVATGLTAPSGTYVVPGTGITITFGSGSFTYGNNYAFNSTPAILVAPVSGSLTALGVDELSVRWWGAVGNGTNDDWAAIQATIHAAAAAGVGIVHFPPGLYPVSSPLLCPANVSLVGKGHPAGGLSALANMFPTLLHNFVGDLIHFSGYGYQGNTAQTSGGGVERLRIVQNTATTTSTITGATNASPIVVTTGASHNLTTGQRVVVSGVLGNTAANNTLVNPEWTVTVLSSTTFSLNGSTGNGTWTSGGTQEVVQLAGSAIKVDAANNNYRPAWLRFLHLMIEEAGVGPWEWAVNFDGSNLTSPPALLPDMEINDISTHTTGAGAVRCWQATVVVYNCTHYLNANYLVSGASSAQGQLSATGVSLMNLTLDQAVNCDFTGGLIGGTVTATANTTAPNMILPGRMAQASTPSTAFVDGSNGALGGVYFDPTGTTNLAGSIAFHTAPALQNSQYIAGWKAGGHTATVLLLGLDVNGAIRLGVNNGVVCVGNDPATATIGAVDGDLGMTNGNSIRWPNAATNAALRLLGIDGSNNVWLGEDAAGIRLGPATTALGTGSTATLGKVGGSGPATATQNGWMEFIDSSGNPFWVPIWR